MNLFAIVVALTVEHIWSLSQSWRVQEYYQRYITASRRFWGESDFYDGPRGVLSILLPAILLTLLLQQLFSYGVMVAFGLFLSLVALLCSLGFAKLRQQINSYVESMDAGNEDRAFELAADMLNKAVPIDEGERDKKLIHLLLAKFNDRLVGVLFWFALLGPVGAVLFRLAVELKERCESHKDDSDYASAVWVLYGVLGWLPTRITGVVFAILGSFSEAMRMAKEAKLLGGGAWVDNNQRILIGSGMGALRMDNESIAFSNNDVKRVLNLLRNAVFVWLFLIALVMMLL